MGGIEWRVAEIARERDQLTEQLSDKVVRNENFKQIHKLKGEIEHRPSRLRLHLVLLPSAAATNPSHPTSFFLDMKPTENPDVTPRRTQTDADRRRMFIHHEENLIVKQVEIGGNWLYSFLLPFPFE